MRCPECSREVLGDSCVYCGAPLAADPLLQEPALVTAEPVMPEPVITAEQQPAAAPAPAAGPVAAKTLEQLARKPLPVRKGTRKRVRRRSSSHRSTASTEGDSDLDDFDERPHLGPEGSAISCPECGSFYTRLSKTKQGALLTYVKGTLYRCRNCKSHFRIRDPQSLTVLTLAGVVLASALIITAFLLGPDIEQRVQRAPRPAVARQSAVPGTLPPRSGDPLADEAGDLTQQMADLYEQARSFTRDFPALEESYRVAIARLQDRIQRPPEPGASGADAAGAKAAAIAALGNSMERQHDRTAAVQATFRHTLDDLMSRGASVEQRCAKVHDGAGRLGEEYKACASFANGFIVLKDIAPIALNGFAHVETVYQASRQEVARIAAENGKPAADRK